MAMLGLSSHSPECVHPVVNSTLGTMANAGPKDHLMGYFAIWRFLVHLKGIIRDEEKPDVEMEAQSQAATEGGVLS